MKCIWCDIETTTKKTDKNKREYANIEHIISESVGGRETLLQGKVCKHCNTQLSYLDNWLKREDIMMLNQYQVSSEILGNPTGKKRKGDAGKRKLEEIKSITNIPKTFYAERSENKICLGAVAGKRFIPSDYNKKFSKALHKCAVNILYNDSDYSFMKEQYSELITLVKEDNYDKFHQWHYAVSYVFPNVNQHFDPYFFVAKNKFKTNAIVIVFPAMIVLLGTEPNTITPMYLEQNAKQFEQAISQKNMICLESDKQINITQNYGYFGGSEYNCQNLRFIWRSEEIKGRPNPFGDTFYLLVRCKNCWQTNPSGMSVNKNIFLQKRQILSKAKRNSWNCYTKDDLIKMGFTTDKRTESEYEEMITTSGINYSKEDLNNISSIIDCKTTCIKCGNEITFSNEDLFL